MTVLTYNIAAIDYIMWLQLIKSVNCIQYVSWIYGNKEKKKSIAASIMTFSCKKLQFYYKIRPSPAMKMT